MKRAQTASEYLIIFAIVLVIGLFVFSVLSNSTSTNSESAQDRINLELLQVGILHKYCDSEKSSFTLRNNQNQMIQILNVTISGLECNNNEFSRILRIGESFTLSCEPSCEDLSITQNRFSHSNDVCILWQPINTNAIYQTGNCNEISAQQTHFDAPSPQAPTFQWSYTCDLDQTHTAGSICDSGDLDSICYINTLKNLNNNTAIFGTGSLVIQNGGELRTAAEEFFTLHILGNVTIETGGIITGNIANRCVGEDMTILGNINLNSKGFQGVVGQNGRGPGGSQGTSVTINIATPGAGHAAMGGLSTTASLNPGNVYGNFTHPILLGSSAGGMSSLRGGHGGGAIQIHVGQTATINGTISANGGNGLMTHVRVTGGGSAGSIFLSAENIKGSGTLQAIGGNGIASNPYQSGGGTIHLQEI